MSFNGTNIKNAGTNLFADVNGGSVAPGTNLIIYTLNQPGGTANQDWRFEPVNAGTNLYAIRSLLTGQYASVDEPAAGQAVKTSLVSTAWQVAIVDTFTRNISIRLPNTNLVWSVPNGSGARTHITLAVNASANNKDQQWSTATI